MVSGTSSAPSPAHPVRITARLPDCWAEREFAYAVIHSFFTRCRIYLPTEPDYEVGGRKETWWLGGTTTSTID